MPMGDGTGPMGIGPMTGRCRGTCQSNRIKQSSGYGNGMRNGAGRGLGRGNGFCRMGVYGVAPNILAQPKQDELKKNN